MQLINHVQGPINWNDMSQLFQMEVGHRHLFGYKSRDGKTLVEVDDENGRKLLEVNANITLRYLMCELWGPHDYQVVEYSTDGLQVADGSMLLTMLLHEVDGADIVINP